MPELQEWTYHCSGRGLNLILRKSGKYLAFFLDVVDGVSWRVLGCTSLLSSSKAKWWQLHDAVSKGRHIQSSFIIVFLWQGHWIVCLMTGEKKKKHSCFFLKKTKHQKKIWGKIKKLQLPVLWTDEALPYAKEWGLEKEARYFWQQIFCVLFIRHNFWIDSE